jgi:hypothetical protein
MLARARNMKVLIVGYVWPELTSSAAGLRDWNLVKSFQQQEWQVLYSSQSKENQFSKQLEREGVTAVRCPSNDSGFDEFIKKEKPDFVVFDRYVTEEQFGWRVREHSPTTVQILDTQDLHFLRKQRQVAHESGNVSLDAIAKGDIELMSETTLREIASMYRSDCTILISDFEFYLLTKVFHMPPSMLHVSRLNYEPLDAFRSLEKRTKDFCMIGNFRHAPNYDATLWLKNKIWPLIREQLPTAEVDIYGAYPPKEIMSLSNPEDGFNVRGPVKDHMGMFQKYRINLAPLRFGAGIKGKISDGWHCGTPAVSTPIGAEGMNDYFPFGGEVSSFTRPTGTSCNDDTADFAAESFATKAVSLYLDETKWKESQRRGGEIMRNLYSHDINSKCLISRMLHTKNNLEQIRRQNLIGSILNYQLNRVTKYFSQWIEEKNKNKNMNENGNEID